ncbi:MAG: TolB family protein, partial [Acidimicrobiales bacterium]
MESKSRSDDFFAAVTDAGAEPDGAAADDWGGDGSDGDERGVSSKPRSDGGDGGDEQEAAPVVELPSGRLVFDSDRSGNLDLWLLEAGSDDPRQLTTDQGYDRNPTFVP